jgi:hypothetical protein
MVSQLMLELLDDKDQSGERLPSPTSWNDPAYRFDVLLAIGVIVGLELLRENIRTLRFGSVATLLSGAAFAGVVSWAAYRYVRLIRRLLRNHRERRVTILVSSILCPIAAAIYVYARFTKNDLVAFAVISLTVVIVGWRSLAARP